MKSSPTQALPDHRSVTSPTRKMVADVARAYGGVAAAAKENREDF
jgi:hypothetical protein